MYAAIFADHIDNNLYRIGFIFIVSFEFVWGRWKLLSSVVIVSDFDALGAGLTLIFDKCSHYNKLISRGHFNF